MSRADEDRARCISVSQERGEFGCLEDGFVYYFPSKGGAIAAHQLRWLADELDRRNEEWQQQINQYFEQQISEAADDPDSD